VPGCKSRTNKGQKFYRYPRDIARRGVWIKSIKPQNGSPIDNSRICEVIIYFEPKKLLGQKNIFFYYNLETLRD
jgi:hypothetical protein